MSAIKDKVGFKGTLQQFFEHMRDGKQFYYPNTPREADVSRRRSQKALAAMAKQLPRYFGRCPRPSC